MGDLYRALGQLDEARAAYLQSLAMFERLAAAEPERADHQRDLVVSLVRAGTSGDQEAKERLLRAISILETLKSRGQLNPADEPMIASLNQLLRERGLRP